MRIAFSAVFLLGCAAAAPPPRCPDPPFSAPAPLVPPAPPPAVGAVEAASQAIDLVGLVERAHRIVLEHATGGLVGGQNERFEIVRSGESFYGAATFGEREPSGKLTAKTKKLIVTAAKVEEALVLLAKAKRGEPDSSKIVIDASDTYLAWSLTIDEPDVCPPRMGCFPARSIRLTSRPDGHGFYHWQLWDAGGKPIAIDRAAPNDAANALRALLTRA